ncbi:molybdopterin molybdotransferase MoeA [Paracoccus sp. JM45]|uniref:molybdopterin molybdotransferase MoeA n=1 Tax=Paracoccus sp. JM45 TaxID=2283626 RepID=UPI000E6D2542|nr:molybdopterin molybdotransferase MoeA [Paracoccus sp. JM45]RJE81174.1 molybdopterin molybdenumtransferase MoeA [Paracoccus sp. JM45]
MITVPEALSRVLALAGKPQAETIGLAQAHGRALLEPAVARLTQPPFNASAMDGYAMRAVDMAGPMQVVGTAAAGHPWQGQASAGQALRIFTGAAVPDGFDHVELQEHIDRNGDVITVTTRSSGSNIRAKGNDFAQGDVMQAGRVLSAADIGLLAAMNLPKVTVAKRPVVAILAGGDELLPPGSDPQPGQIISSNDLAIAAMVTQAGGVANILPIARDTDGSLRASFAAARGADLIVTIGGASVGDHDLVGKIAAELGLDRAFYKIAMRPGKPLMAGKLLESAMLGLPGNPVSAMTCGILFMQPLIRAMQGLPAGIRTEHALLGVPLKPEGPRQHYLRAKLDRTGMTPVITPFSDQDSARLSLMSQADALLIRPAHDPQKNGGEVVEYIPLGL